MTGLAATREAVASHLKSALSRQINVTAYDPETIHQTTVIVRGVSLDWGIHRHLAQMRVDCYVPYKTPSKGDKSLTALLDSIFESIQSFTVAPFQWAGDGAATTIDGAGEAEEFDGEQLAIGQVNFSVIVDREMAVLSSGFRMVVEDILEAAGLPVVPTSDAAPFVLVRDAGSGDIRLDGATVYACVETGLMVGDITNECVAALRDDPRTIPVSKSISLDSTPPDSLLTYDMGTINVAET